MTRSTVLAWSLAALIAAPVMANSTSQVAARVGITPESIVLADVAEDAALVLAILDADSELRAQLDQVDAAIRQSSRAVTAARAALREAEDVDAAWATLVSARSTYDQNVAAREAALVALRSAACRDLAPDVAVSLARFNRALRAGLPAELCVVDLDQHQQRRLRKALRAEARAVRHGVALDTEIEQYLAAIRTRPEVVQAQQRLAQDLTDVREAFASLN